MLQVLPFYSVWLNIGIWMTYPLMTCGSIADEYACGSCVCFFYTIMSCIIMSESNCDSCWNDYIECPPRIFIENTMKRIDGFAEDFYITGTPKNVMVDIGTNSEFRILSQFSEELVKREFNVIALAISKSTKIRIDEVKGFYETHKRSLRQLCIDGTEITTSGANGIRESFDLTSGSTKTFQVLHIRNLNDKVNLKADDGILIRSDTEMFTSVDLTTTFLSKDFDIYLDVNPNWTPNKLTTDIDKIDKIWLNVTCTARANYSNHTFPRIIFTDDYRKFREKIFSFIAIYSYDCEDGDKEFFVPESFLAYVDYINSFHVYTMPVRVEYGAFGTDLFKVLNTLILVDKTTYSENLTTKWQPRECLQMKPSDLCILCYMQRYGMHRKDDNLENICNFREEAPLDKIEVRKCLWSCPKSLKYANAVKSPSYIGYELCGKNENLTRQCREATMSEAEEISDRSFLTHEKKTIQIPWWLTAALALVSFTIVYIFVDRVYTNRVRKFSKWETFD